MPAFTLINKLAAVSLLILVFGGPLMAAEVGRDGEPFADMDAWALRADPNSNCFINHGGLGCDDAECEATVCAIDPFCCETNWDSICAGEALDLCEIDVVAETIRMEVNKIWVDTDLDVWDNPLQPVTVQLTCNTGLPLQQQAEITQAEGVVFVVREVVDFFDVTCTVTEISDSIPGFKLWSVAQDGLIPDDLEEGGCVFNLGDLDVLNSCLLINQALPGTYTVATEWNIFEGADSGGDFVDQDVEICVQCSEFITEVNGVDIDPELDICFDLEGDDAVVFTVYTEGDGGAFCTAFDSINASSIEKDGTTCGGSDFIPAGGSNGCVFVYTVFFEGIPTLSQYGLAIMALLMLGVGFVGFRRFV